MAGIFVQEILQNLNKNSSFTIGEQLINYVISSGQFQFVRFLSKRRL